MRKIKAKNKIIKKVYIIMPSSYPSTGLHKANNFSTIFDKTILPYNKQYDNCKNTLCYTYSKNNIYKPHSAVGMVGTIASSTLARKHRI